MFSPAVWFWIVVGVFFGPVVIIACIISIVKAVVDRKRIKRNIAAKRLAALGYRGESSPPAQRVKKPNIQFLDDEQRRQKWMNRSPSIHFSRKTVVMGTEVDTNISNHADFSDISISSRTDEDKKSHKKNGHKNNGHHSVHVTVEQNAMIPNGLGVHDGTNHQVHQDLDSKGRDNLGGSFSEEYTSSSQSDQGLEMGNMRVVVHAMTTSPDLITRQVDTDIDYVSESQIASASNPTKSDNCVADYSEQRQQLQHGKQTQMYQQFQHRPQKPKRNGHHGQHDFLHNQKVHRNGSMKNLNDGFSVLPPFGTHDVRGSRSHEYDLDIASTYEGSSRRNSDAAAIDREYKSVESSRTRSLSEDNIKIHSSPYPPYQNALPFYKHVSCREEGKINKAFIRSTEAPLAEM